MLAGLLVPMVDQRIGQQTLDIYIKKTDIFFIMFLQMRSPSHYVSFKIKYHFSLCCLEKNTPSNCIPSKSSWVH